jgi:hypothetical protein
MHKRLNYGLAGLQTGITGAIAMLAYYSVASLWTKHSLWWMPNLFAASIQGQSAVGDGSGFFTLSGLALVLCYYGALGVVFGQIAAEHQGGLRFFWLSLLTAMLMHFAELRWFWKGLNPVGHLYASDHQILFAHLVLGCCLGAYPGARQKLIGQ